MPAIVILVVLIISALCLKFHIADIPFLKFLIVTQDDFFRLMGQAFHAHQGLVFNEAPYGSGQGCIAGRTGFFCPNLRNETDSRCFGCVQITAETAGQVYRFYSLCRRTGRREQRLYAGPDGSFCHLYFPYIRLCEGDRLSCWSHSQGKTCSKIRFL